MNMHRTRRLRRTQRSAQYPFKQKQTEVSSYSRIALLTSLIFAACTATVQAQVATGTFSADDTQYLQQVANPLLQTEAATSGVAQVGEQENRRELLLMERRVASEKSSNSTREADVYIYDYSTDEVIHLIVDLEDRSVTRRERVQNVQLPLTAAEVKRAIDIVFVDEANSEAIGEEFYRITGRRLESAQQIQYKAFVFLASSVSEAKAVNTRECGLKRCAKLLLYTADNMALDLSPIVNLSSKRVLQIVDNPREGG